MQSRAARRWSRLVTQAESSGLTTREFARSQDINPRTLTWWRWKLRQDDGTGSDFVEVAVDDDPPVLQLVVGAALFEVDADTDLQLLRRVVEALS